MGGEGHAKDWELCLSPLKWSWAHCSHANGHPPQGSISDDSDNVFQLFQLTFLLKDTRLLLQSPLAEQSSQLRLRFAGWLWLVLPESWMDRPRCLPYVTRLWSTSRKSKDPFNLLKSLECENPVITLGNWKGQSPIFCVVATRDLKGVRGLYFQAQFDLLLEELNKMAPSVRKIQTQLKDEGGFPQSSELSWLLKLAENKEGLFSQIFLSQFIKTWLCIIKAYIYIACLSFHSAHGFFISMLWFLKTVLQMRKLKVRKGKWFSQSYKASEGQAGVQSLWESAHHTMGLGPFPGEGFLKKFFFKL